ncbi:adenylate/guanylate cyclase domain-containing protein [Spirochaeta africana]|uniref:PAS domain S-box n=1 Tax=Spirochaeta africana (strain ATCC 700263 / DSM 8902 / Z-7692) TaxID=889378 RepID=H9UHY4_SPIAZ|nr:adenylate/guanylate cyclase domain-containing protein [Spirochaeta africana]AFG37127.1 PAS domain S-box [Spirochaeta africana DSM 8902]
MDAQQTFRNFVRAGTLLAARSTRQDQLQVLVDQTYDITNAALCCAYIYPPDDSTEQFLLLSARRGRRAVTQRIPLKDELIGFMEDCREALVLSEPHPHYFHSAFLDPQMYSAAVLPLFSGSSSIGIVILNAEQPGFFRRDRFSFLESFVQLASGTLHSAALYRQLQDQYRAIEELERYQSSIFSSMTNLLVTLDEKGHIEYANDIAREKLGIRDEDLGRKFYSVFTKIFSKKILSAIQHAENTGSMELGLQGILQRDGQQIDFALNISPLRGKRGRKEGVILLFTDQTAEKQLKSEMSTVVEERRAIKDMFARYLSNDIVQSLMQTPELVRPGGDKKTATIFFADIRGYTAFTESKDPEFIIGVLNDYFSEAVEVILKYRGFIDKFIGDCIMAAWGVPMYSAESDAVSAVSCAVELQELVRSPKRRFFTGDASHLKIGIGMHTGPLIAGNLGSDQRMDYSVIGDTVNVAARLEGVAGPNDIIITQDTRDLIGDRFRLKELEPVSVKGKRKPLHIFKVEKLLR